MKFISIFENGYLALLFWKWPINITQSDTNIIKNSSKKERSFAVKSSASSNSQILHQKTLQKSIYTITSPTLLSHQDIQQPLILYVYASTKGLWGNLYQQNQQIQWHRGYHYYTTSFNEPWWWGTLTMVPAANNAKRLSPVSLTTKTIHHQITCPRIW